MFEFERLTTMKMLYNAWRKILAKCGGAGADGVDLSFYESDLAKNLRTLQCAVISENYKPFREKTCTCNNREISIYSIDDKIIQTAIAEIINSTYNPSECVHGFVKNRSIFSAKSNLDLAIDAGILNFCKVDVKRFYDSIDKDLLLRKIESIIPDIKFLLLTEMILNVRLKGISTGSCLSPILSNLYLSDFDCVIQRESDFYSRYVDDMLVAPAKNIVLIEDELARIGLKINTEKYEEVRVSDGFEYLGFHVEHTIDDAIQTGNFTLAEHLYEVQENDISPESVEQSAMEDEAAIPKTELPEHVLEIEKNCHIVCKLAEKAKMQKYLSYPEKTILLQIFHCLGDDGARYIHYLLSFCIDYDFAKTEKHIKNYGIPNPIGCKKLSERFDCKEQCSCNFSKDRMYPSPIIHAIHVKPDCFTLADIKDNIGHFKAKTPKRKAEDALSSLLDLNKKAYEIHEQQDIFKGQIEDLFERNNICEFQTPQGLLVKMDDGIFIKVG